MSCSMNRAETCSRMRSHSAAWDIIVIGGGATGAGVAIDAAARGNDVLLSMAPAIESTTELMAQGSRRYLARDHEGAVPPYERALNPLDPTV